MSDAVADYIGLQLATAACYDPRAAKGLWERMDSTGSSVDFLSTHPASSKRVTKVEAWAKEVRPRPTGIL